MPKYGATKANSLRMHNDTNELQSTKLNDEDESVSKAKRETDYIYLPAHIMLLALLFLNVDNLILAALV